ncbi:uncharacterized protein LOC128209746 [Mya arenaria]|uniref:uncharacterized protein LOC128209746 n=1 Tax=Mya arenaria TaxID=6604 RepID=UPI0022E5AA86|nr:uncharacterized protein LOC128209746 [Mya arenaria]
MSVIQAILAKACVALCVVGALMVYQEDSSYMLLFTVLISYTLWLIFILIYKGKKTDPAIYNCLQMIYSVMVFALVYSSLHNDESNQLRHEFMVDNLKPYFQYKQTLKWAAMECFSFIVFIWRLMNIFNIGWKRLTAMMLFFTMHACILAIIVEFILTMVASSVWIALVENLMFTFDANNSRDYPEGFFNPKNVSETPYSLPVRETKTYFQDFSGKFVLVNNFETVNSPADPDSSYPLYQMSVERYIGEDVKLSCDYLILDKDRLGRKTFWFFNGTKLTNSSKHNIDTDVKLQDDKWSVHSVLSIKLLHSVDFGEYKCYGKIYHYSKHAKISVVHGLHSTKYLVSILTLKEIHPEIRLLKRSVGNIVATQGHFWYHSNQDINDFHLDYTVNGKSIGLRCPGENSQICSVGATVLRMFLTIGASNFEWEGEQFPYLDVAKVVASEDLNRAIIYYCLCSSGFGVHRISFVRSVVVPTTGRAVLHDIEHPYIYLILPRAGLSLFRVFDDTHLYKEIEDLIDTGVEIEIIEQKVEHLLAFISANEYKVISFTNFCQGILLILAFIVLFFITHITTRYYFRLFIRAPVRRLFNVKPLQHEDVLHLDDFIFDVFISNADEEYNLVTTVLLPYLKEESKVNTCFNGDEYFRGNRPLIHLYLDSISKSRKIIVILSKHYMQDAICENLQLHMIILPLIYERKRIPKDVLFIKYDKDVEFPRILRWDLDVEILDWQTHLGDRVKLKLIRKWMLTGKL